MKKFYEYRSTGGEYAGEMMDHLIPSVPYTDVPPLKGIPIEQQKYDATTKNWMALVRDSLPEETRSTLEKLIQCSNIGDDEALGLKLLNALYALQIF
ncbi:hypothetical protein NRIC_04050 [Enterococcus florum]|uniref:Uncharacterized protein n=1 Tax=Enterococcus florum TaxID=2480627 RepID=A0A4P5P8B9_9ENTE|nr:hypothetical protein [Enterococcus florum]GCF92514.1 hypothetical protein NRIC_04050 [Enterococcus florum]